MLSTEGEEDGMSRGLIVNISLLSLVVLGLMACIRTPEQIARDYIATQIAGPQGTAEAWIATAQAGGWGDYAATAVSIYQTLTPPEPTGHPLHPSITPSATPTVTPMATATPTAIPTQGPDDRPNLSIVEVVPVQVVEPQNGNEIPLVLNKATAIKVVVRKTGPFALSNVEVVVFNDGVPYTEFFVYDDANLAVPNSDPRLLASNLNAHDGEAPFALNFGPGLVEKTVYFFADGFTPTSIGANYFVSAQVDMSLEDAQLYEEFNLADNQVNSFRFEVVDTVWYEGPNDTEPEFIIYVGLLDYESGSEPRQEGVEQYCDSVSVYAEALLPIDPNKLEIRCNPDNVNIISKDEGAIPVKGWLSADSFGNHIREIFYSEHPNQLDVDTLAMLTPRDWKHLGDWPFEDAGAVGYSSSGVDVFYVITDTPGSSLWNVFMHESGHTLGLDHDPKCAYVEAGLFVLKRVVFRNNGGNNFPCDYMRDGLRSHWVIKSHYLHILRTHIP